MGIGFNPWVNIWAHENCSRSLEFISQNLGYRIRPAMVWRRRVLGREEIVLGLRNDGCSPPPGVITIDARFPDGTQQSVTLPAGQPAPGALKMCSLPAPQDAGSSGRNGNVTFSMEMRMRGKTAPVRWAVGTTDESQDNFHLAVPLEGA